MNQTGIQLARHLREVCFGGNWTSVHFENVMGKILWTEATHPVQGVNNILRIFYHSFYYVEALHGVLTGRELNAHDEYSFNHPPVHSDEDWSKLQMKFWRTAEDTARMLEKTPDEKFLESFTDERYGTYYRNVLGTIEHLHYHLGQIVILHRLLAAKALSV
ncbi:MAG: hypothetical protein K1X68_08760 [Saprospiraceae bacterium]|nr:hypothetical protein [Saprospiraceae bacterium]HMW38386.1 hypothetical protein [Saprospiraceae bacterium]HMX87281.1 hypothetical protein [Saprospiraceae bacterium]HMZ39108.1 hypothetical protein [Saprospiraceae bacterium]HNA63281.1 hypothetical protein [Saprospiraceae bacterium]